MTARGPWTRQSIRAYRAHCHGASGWLVALAGGTSLTVLFVVLVVYVPFGVAERASLEGINYLADTLMSGGAILLLAGAMRGDTSRAESPADRLSS